MSKFDKIIDAVLAETDGITIDDIMAQNRSRTYSIPRHLIMYMALEQGYSSTMIGEALKRTHVTVLYGHRCVSTWQENPLSYKRELEFFERVKNKLNI